MHTDIHVVWYKNNSRATIAITSSSSSSSSLFSSSDAGMCSTIFLIFHKNGAIFQCNTLSFLRDRTCSCTAHSFPLATVAEPTFWAIASFVDWCHMHTAKLLRIQTHVSVLFSLYALASNVSRFVIVILGVVVFFCLQFTAKIFKFLLHVRKYAHARSNWMENTEQKKFFQLFAYRILMH